ncbi:MAG: bifunctional adenosylcobinamide kinase/adenosylcobinamide-phosphate guanylyltransferase [Clostridiales bacterium]|nr:bifunctional adenosylcobinamide kinase/adenosylcobinamide-phosphate guanylyltransferase [Clostridiales bacterium]MCF8023398.1 bifunctional adenosylcobinamide kinase/adenosylcobinamide-phosphate guanylyltransferase [Clostridiales bacterium]
MLKDKIILVMGGARSGKSSYAERIARESGMKVIYVATSQVLDKEMELRVKKHRERRPTNWQTLEEPLCPRDKLEHYIDSSTLVLVDCLTLWVSNLLLHEALPFRNAGFEEKKEYILNEVHDLLYFFRNNNISAILVSNETGTGLVPGDAISRTYRDVVGKVNQLCAEFADYVYVTFAGIPVDIKRLTEI